MAGVSLIDIQLEILKEFERFRKDYLKHAKEIKRISREIFGKKLEGVYVFGSIVKGKSHPMSDVDIAIILSVAANEVERTKLYGKVRKKFGLAHPFEVHILSVDEWEWYRRFVKNDLLRV
ncbi:hypothetical protein DRP07_04330 [Archaeoglobales archaeon]|nr:MAG: hypothetical protein DRP07_04330 [Archaeoglobales archaeon]